MKRSFLKLALASLVALPLLSACVTTEAPDHPEQTASVHNLQGHPMPPAPPASSGFGMGARGPMGDVPPPEGYKPQAMMEMPCMGGMGDMGPMGGPQMMERRGKGPHGMMRGGKPCPRMQAMMAQGFEPPPCKPCKCPCAEKMKKSVKKSPPKPEAPAAETPAKP